MTQTNALKIETVAAQASHHIDSETGAVNMSVHLSTTFERDPDGEYSRGYIYSRNDNPNRHRLEEILAELEGGFGAIAFSSGSAATATVFQALSAGDHVVAPNDCYYGTARLLRDMLAPWGLDSTFVDMTDLSQVIGQ